MSSGVTGQSANWHFVKASQLSVTAADCTGTRYCTYIEYIHACIHMHMHIPTYTHGMMYMQASLLRYWLESVSYSRSHICKVSSTIAKLKPIQIDN